LVNITREDLPNAPTANTYVLPTCESERKHVIEGRTPRGMHVLYTLHHPLALHWHHPLSPGDWIKGLVVQLRPRGAAGGSARPAPRAGGACSGQRTAPPASARRLPAACRRAARRGYGVRQCGTPPPSRTDWTRLVPPPVLTGHVSSLLPYRRPLVGGAHAPLPSDLGRNRAPRTAGRPRLWSHSRPRAAGGGAPPPPTVAPTHVPTVHSLC
jgi:hypothetical protein